MEQEDYLKRQIDQLGRALGKILADLLGLSTRGQASSGIEAADQALKNELNLNIDELTSIPSDKFIDTLLVGRKLSNETLEELAEILFQIAEIMESNKSYKRKKELYEKSLLLYEYTDKSSTTYSFDRHQKIENIKRLIDKSG